MTISVAKFVAAPAANPAATAISGTAGQADSILAGDFANLLLGQLAGEQLASDSAMAGKTGKEFAAEGTDGMAVTDSAQLFAALGLPVPVTADLAGRPKAAVTSDLAGDTPESRAGRIATLAGAASGQVADGDLAGASVKAPETDRNSFAEVMRATSGQESGQATATGDIGNAAKLAGSGKAGIELPASAHDTSNVQASTPAPTAPAIHMAATHATPPASTENSLHLATPLKDAAWPAELSQKVVWMARQDLQSAQITLNPPQLGPIEIALDIRNEQASAVFVSGSAEVREAIESALPRLREMLAGVGVELGQANVSHESFRQASDQGSQQRPAAAGGSNTGVDRGSVSISAAGSTVAGARAGNGLVDTFA